MQVYKLLNIHEYREKYNIPEAKFQNYRVAYDGKIYLTMVTTEEYTIKDRAKGWRKGYRHEYHYFRITFDWKEGRVVETEQFEFNLEKKWLHYWLPLKDDFLLVCARTDNSKKSPNAFVVDKEGNLIRKFFIGDAIEECCTTPSGKIIAGYMDEGIDSPWDTGARHGVTMWDEDGKKIWWNRKCDIWHCYALNLDPQKCLWFYYYGRYDEREGHFHLVYSNKEKMAVFTPEITGSNGFAVSRDHKRVLLGGDTMIENQYICSTWIVIQRPCRINKK